jgi:AsmA protein
LNVDIAGLELSNGEVHFYDNPTGYSARLVRLNVATGRVTADQPFDVTLKGQLFGDFPVANASVNGQAIVKFNAVNGVYSAQKLALQVAGRLNNLYADSLALRGTELAYNAQSGLLDAGGVELALQGALKGETPIDKIDTRLTVPRLRFDRSRFQFRGERLAYRAKAMLGSNPVDIALDAPSLSISPETAQGDPVTGTVKFGKDQKVTGVSLTASGLSGNALDLQLKELKLDTSVKEGARLVRVNVSSPARWEMFRDRGSLSAIKGDLHIEDPALPSGTFSAPFIGSVQADLLEDTLNSQLNAVLNGSNLEINLKATDLAVPRVNVALTTQKLDLDQLFPPTAAKPASDKTAGKASGSSKDKTGPQDSNKSKETPAAQPAQTFDLSFLKTLDVTANLTIGELRVQNLKASAVKAALRAAEGKLVVSGLQAQTYGGSLAGTLSADAGNALAADVSLKGVQLGSLLTDLTGKSQLTGTGTVALKLGSRGQTVSALQAGLNGTVLASVRDGAVKGINVAQTLREVSGAVRDVISGKVPDIATQFDASRQTDFSSLDLDVLFAKGQGTVRKARLVAPLLRITEDKPATVDLVNQQIDLMLNVSVVNSGSGQDGKELDVLRGVTVPIRVSGPLMQPGYQVQWKEIGGKAVKQAVQDGLLDLLSNKLGAPAGSAPAAPNSSTKESAPKAPVDPVKSLGDALKGLLR